MLHPDDAVVVAEGETNDASSEEARYLRLLRDEGLELLAKFKMIEDKKTRQLVIDLATALAEGRLPDQLDG